MKKGDRIFIAGHNGLVGSSIVRLLIKKGYQNLILVDSKSLDLRDQQSVNSFFQHEHPEYVFLAAAKVGGILANSTFPADFIYDNLAIEINVINAAYRSDVKKLLFLGSSCIYPKNAPQPISEDSLLTGPLEYTNEWYAVAKIAGLKLCQAYRRQYEFNAISLMPTNLYGPGDNFDLQGSHVLPALIRKFHEAKIAGEKKVEIWGTGRPRREFLHIDDLADASLYLMEHYNDEEIINVGVGKDISIAELAELIGEIVGFTGSHYFDRSKPDGTFQKLLDISRINNIGWSAKVGLKEGIARVYQWYLKIISKQ